jgi:hypothetical protein
LAGLCTPEALAQGFEPVGYRLQSGSQITQRLCLPPCLCPYREFTGDLIAEFTLTLTERNPLFNVYSVTGFAGSAVLNGQPVRLTGYGSYRRGGEVAIQQQLVLDLLVDGAAQHFDSGLVAGDPLHPFPEVHITAETEVFACRQQVLEVFAAPDPTVCYADCDPSSPPPRLNVNDFVCFITRFAAGDPWANCDGSTQPPVLNVNDFVCFQASFAAGCP